MTHGGQICILDTGFDTTWYLAVNISKCTELDSTADLFANRKNPPERKVVASKRSTNAPSTQATGK